MRRSQMLPIQRMPTLTPAVGQAAKLYMEPSASRATVVGVVRHSTPLAQALREPKVTTERKVILGWLVLSAGEVKGAAVKNSLLA